MILERAAEFRGRFEERHGLTVGAGTGAPVPLAPGSVDGARALFDELLEHAVDMAVESVPGQLERRFADDSAAALCMWFARVAYASEPMPGGPKARWLHVLRRDIGAFRPGFEMPEGAATERWFRPIRAHFLACADQLFVHGGIWAGMHPLLMSIRALRSPCVASDLRYWKDPEFEAAYDPRQPEELWSCIPATLVAGVHGFAGREERSDPDLSGLRANFAKYCLQGLKDRKDPARADDRQRRGGRSLCDQDMIETDPRWRFFRARAVKTLAINPQRRGHLLLKWSAQNDPDASVREAANDAYQSLRRGNALPEGASPRRAILGAFWWLRHAHLLALGCQIDIHGSHRTRVKELARTKEPGTERNAI